MTGKKMHIVLIGMPASGKTTLFRHLTQLGYIQGYDTDDVIQLHTLLEETCTPSEFYDGERDKIVHWLSDTSHFPKRTIIATGGSIVHRPESIEAFRKLPNVNIIWLYTPYTVIEKRLGDWKSRGIVMPPSITTLRELFQFREPLYRSYADFIINTDTMTIDECASSICRYTGCK
jgi:shikimate kinase